MSVESIEQYRIKKLKGYSGFEKIDRIYTDSQAIFLPEVNINTWEGLSVQVLGAVTPYHECHPDFNKQLRLYATVDGENELAGYLGVNLHQATPYYYNANHAIATWTRYRGVATALEAANQFILNGIAAYTDIEIGATLHFRSFDENGRELKELEAKYKGTPTPEMEAVLHERKKHRDAWLRLFEKGGLLGFERAVDDPEKIERDVIVRKYNPELSKAMRIFLKRDDRNALFNPNDYYFELSANDAFPEERRQQFSRLLTVQLPK